MGRSRIVVVLTCSLLAASSYSLKADVRADEKSHVELADHAYIFRSGLVSKK